MCNWFLILLLSLPIHSHSVCYFKSWPEICIGIVPNILFGVKLKDQSSFVLKEEEEKYHAVVEFGRGINTVIGG